MAKDVILKKQEAVAEVVSKMQAAKAVIAFDYQGLTVESFMKLRRNLLKSGCEICVLKNNISRRAAEECGFTALAADLKGPKAICFSNDDIIAPAKELFAFARENDKVKVARGVVNGDEYDYAQLEVLATLPSYETLLTQLAAGMLGTLRHLSIGLNMLTEQEQA